MNQGLKELTGDVVIFLNADDTFDHPNVLSDVDKAFQQNPKTDIVYGI